MGSGLLRNVAPLPAGYRRPRHLAQQGRERQFWEEHVQPLTHLKPVQESQLAASRPREQ